ncbi:DUF4062 domain-containing protein [Shewanella baltica]|uniref:DUF4062 domain-containing protein n=1 Tax=Shewanella baltica TaxID=62322 RepID=UPI002167907B|nr:DUF4062 domain-containing protein [Shewanella baltica]MCS6116336.1 DUF4062 domain-containing protein [Shewanella baltica]UVW66077.1 DUF4062 domain-containing protein [Shewanella baltica]
MSKKLTVMVSSTVYGVEELLDRVYSLLTAFGYEVWMSHKGTVPVSSNETAFESCLKAVEKCDLFLGIITPQYGSGVDATGLSITHQEMKKAIELNKPRWFLAHDHVVFARKLLNDLWCVDDDENARDENGKRVKGPFVGTEGRSKLKLSRKASSISDIRVIQMYEDATMEQLPQDDRQGNWVQKFDRDDDANLFVVAQFSRYQDVEQRLTEHFQNVSQVSASVGARHE